MAHAGSPFGSGQQFGYGQPASGGFNPLMGGGGPPRGPPPAHGSHGVQGSHGSHGYGHGHGAAGSSSGGSGEEEVKLYSTSREREAVENMADLYAIIMAVELLEKAYIRDSISADEYTPACSKLIAQFKAAQNLLRDVVPDVQVFMAEYRMECPAAVNRLLTIGVPATVEHGSFQADDAGKSAQHVAEAVHYFITAMDTLKLNMTAVDEIHPVLKDVLQGLNAVPNLPPDFEGKTKIKAWLTQLNQMQASDDLSESQLRQLLFELESAYDAFHKALK